MGIEKVICWDLDGTLGLFDGIGAEVRAELKGEAISSYDRSLTSKATCGIRDVVRGFADKGYEQVITTGANMEGYPERVLDKMGLLSCFSGVYSRDSTDRHDVPGKSYGHVARDSEIGEDEAGNRMLIIGDSWQDRPVDLENTVFVYNREGYNYDANVVARVVEKLERANGDSFYSAFELLREAGSVDDAELVDFNNAVTGPFPSGGQGDSYMINKLGDDLAIGLGYEKCKNLGLIVPGQRFPDFSQSRLFQGPIVNILPEASLKKPLEELG